MYVVEGLRTGPGVALLLTAPLNEDPGDTDFRAGDP
jgi:hypothetical protein